MSNERPDIENEDSMPKSIEDLVELKQRAELFARNLDAEENDEQRLPYIRFRLGEAEEYGILYRYAEEILPLNAVTHVPCTPPHIYGVTNRRGQMLTVLDLKHFFKARSENQYDEKAAILVVQASNLLVGLLVDEMLGSDEYQPSRLTVALPSKGVSNLDYVAGIVNGRITMLDLDVLLGDAALLVNESVT